MDDTKLNKEIAKAFGWRVAWPNPNVTYITGKHGPFDPCNDWNDMREVVDKMREQGFLVSIIDKVDYHNDYLGYGVSFTHKEIGKGYGYTEDEKAGRAVVKAALKAKGVDVQ